MPVRVQMPNGTVRPLVSAIQKNTGMDVNSIPPAIQAAIWSMGVQHSLKGSSKFTTQAIRGLTGDPASADYQDQLLKGTARGQYITGVDAYNRAHGKAGIQYLGNILKRYDREYASAKQMYGIK